MAVESSPHLLQLGKAHTQNADPEQPKINKIELFKKFSLKVHGSIIRLGISGPDEPPKNIQSYALSDAEWIYTHHP